MTQLAAALHQTFPNLRGPQARDSETRPWDGRALARWFVLAALLALALSSAETAQVMVGALSEAYVTVTVFVAGTLALVYGLERAFKADLGKLLTGLARWQVPAGALLGAFPGCGGAIVMVTHYTKGHVSFGTLVATLTATMGDAMFLLLAKEPMTGLTIFALGLVIGSLSGLAVDALHGRAFLRPAIKSGQPTDGDVAGIHCQPAEISPGQRRVQRIWLALLVPGLALGLLGAFQVDLVSLFALPASLDPAVWIGLPGALLALALWAKSGEAHDENSCRDAPSSVTGRIVADSNFITAWVVFAFLTFELGVHWTGVDLAANLQLWAPLVPLAAVLVGFLPGCGPQIVVTTLYLAGSLPLSAQLGNAISNDGDALFPALALAPKAALLATLYSAVPALLLAYGAHLAGL